MGKTKVVLGQLGSPKSTSTKDVRSYLKEFLGDPRVVDAPRLLWWIILNLFVLPFRPKKSAQAYSRIYNGKSFPLVDITNDFGCEVAAHVDSNIEINSGFLLSYPRVDDLLDSWEAEDFDDRANELVVIPQFPQFSESTVASVFDVVGKAFSKRVNFPDIRFITNYHKLKAFIDLSVKKIEDTLEGKDIDALVISFHGIPTRRVIDKKDEYYLHCYETFCLIKEKLKEEYASKIHMCFQSRFGSEKWLGPATDEYAVALVEEHGHKNIACYCPSFVVDCLETTDEIGNELREELEEVGGHLEFIPCLNADKDWAKSFAIYINTLVNGTKSEVDSLFYQTNRKKMRADLPVQEYKKPLDKEAKQSLKIMFLTLFLDLVGFSIIFPLFPAIAKYYLEVDSDSFLLNKFLTLSGSLSAGSSLESIVLFGGILGALYSLLQFIFAPIWGKLSDKHGRKPILTLSVFGIFIGYIVWIFSGSFLLLLLSRVITGIMGGNLSVATAVASDVTDTKNRSSAMAFVGIAFAFGFLVGPALGGILSLIDLTSIFEGSKAYGINPFSMPAIFAAVLSFLNLILIIKVFKETNVNKSSDANKYKSFNPLTLFKSENKKIATINWSYFLFIFIFSGMEFTLTFLALERLNYSSMSNAYMFIYIGFVLAFVQGGYVRRKANLVGEKKMAAKGMSMIIPGLVILAFANNSFLLFFGLTFLAMGSAMVIPCLTALVSLYADERSMGKSLGTFRSLGSLARVFGPLCLCVLFWKIGSTKTFIISSVAMILPIFVLRSLPALSKK
ncbi:MAG: ferrochelatase [Bacteriovoracaceae bacterium]|jgi:ferrochelatase|nr:ferrochelatase [Bacteriovoracaceae bacterium]